MSAHLRDPGQCARSNAHDPRPLGPGAARFAHQLGGLAHLQPHAVEGGGALGFQLGGWIFIHGVTELFAVTLAGAAGFRLGWTLAFPGGRTRVEAMGQAGRLAATVMAGVVVMLFCAGLLEGFARQLVKLDLVRWAIALATGLGWAAYFYLSRPREAPLEHG